MSSEDALPAAPSRQHQAKETSAHGATSDLSTAALVPEPGARQNLKTPPAPSQASALAELAGLFLKLGTLAFGGPAAHIAMMEEEVVRRRGWMTHAQFLDYLGITNMVPGPNSTEMAIHVGYARGGWVGLAVAGSCFIGPAAILVGVLAWLYVRFGALPELSGVLYGVKPVVIAVIVQAIWKLARSAVKSKWLAAVAAACVLLVASGVNELLVLAIGAMMGFAGRASRLRESLPPARQALLPLAGSPTLLAASAVGAAPFALKTLFLTFAKMGSVLFGSGYVLVAFLQSDFVNRLGWLSQRQLLDAVAVGQVTPGPVFTTATFIGYILGGLPGAAVATLGIFLPAFFFVAISAPLLPTLRRSAAAGAVLDGINVASLALMAVVTWQLARTAVVDWLTLALALLSAVLLIKVRVNSVWLVGGAALTGGAAVWLHLR